MSFAYYYLAHDAVFLCLHVYSRLVCLLRVDPAMARGHMSYHTHNLQQNLSSCESFPFLLLPVRYTTFSHRGRHGRHLELGDFSPTRGSMQDCMNYLLTEIVELCVPLDVRLRVSCAWAFHNAGVAGGSISNLGTVLKSAKWTCYREIGDLRYGTRQDNQVSGDGGK